MKSNLLPCPFCGIEMIRTRAGKTIGHKDLTGCFLDGCVFSDDAIPQWNKRVNKANNMSNTTRFKVGWKDMETREEKLGFIQLLMYYVLMSISALMSIIAEHGSWQSYVFLAGVLGFAVCVCLQADYIRKTYVARMDPTKDLEDYC